MAIDPQSEAASASVPPSSWLVPVLTLATFVTMLQAMALGPLLPAIAADLDTPVALLGQIPAAMMVLAAVVGFIAGPLADRLGHHRVLTGSLLALVLSSLGMAVSPVYLVLLLTALIGSVGRAVVQPLAVVIVGDRFTGDRQRRAVSWVMAGVTGAVIAGVPALTTVAGAFGWRVAMFSLAVLTATLIPFVHHGLGAAPASEQRDASIGQVWAAYLPLVRHRPTLGLIGATLFGSAGVWIMATYLGAFYADRFAYTTQQVGWVYFVPGVTLFLGSLAAGGRVGTLPLRPLVILARLLVGVVLAGLLALPISAIAGIVLLGVQGIATGLSGVAVVLLLIQESPAGRATTLTLNTVALSLGTAFGSALGGGLLAFGDYPLLGVSAMLLSGASAVLVWTTPAVSTGEPKPHLAA